MSRLLILGAGQYGFAAKEIACAMECFSQIDFLDDQSEIAVGRLADAEHIAHDAAIVAIGDPNVRKELSEKLKNLATLIHPKAIISPRAEIAKGCIIEAGAVISTDAKLGTGTIVMANAVVGHNATVGSYCQLKYNSTVLENHVLPSCTKLDCSMVSLSETIFQ